MRNNNRVIEKANKQVKNDTRREVINSKDIKMKKVITETRGMGKEEAGKEIEKEVEKP